MDSQQKFRAVEFWFEFASTYSYLSAARLPQLARNAGISIVYRPFLLGPIFKEQGWNDSPFNIYPAKGRYMWRDLERRCELYGLPFRRPGDFPRNGLRAARIATALAASPGLEQHLPEFTTAVYRANFAEDQNISESKVLENILRKIPGTAAAETIAQIKSAAASNEIKTQVRANTERAVQLGIFGAPSFVVYAAGTATPEAAFELFWGDDRLADAFALAQQPY